MRVDVGRDGALRERVGDVGPVPVAHGRRRVRRQRVDVPLQRLHRLRRVDDDVVALQPAAAEAAEQRRVDVHVLARAGEAAQREAVGARVGVGQRLRVGDELVVGVGGLQALRVVQVLAVDLHRHFAVVRDPVRLAVDRVGVAPGLDDVFVLEPVLVGERRVVEVLVERLDPLVRDVQRVVHRVGRVRRVGRGLRREVEQRLLADLPRRHLLEAELDAGERLELRLQRDQVLEVARRDDGDGDRLALGLLPVDLGSAVRARGRPPGRTRCRPGPLPTPPRHRRRRPGSGLRGAWDGSSCGVSQVTVVPPP